MTPAVMAPCVLQGCFPLQISGKDCIALSSMDGNTAFSSVRNPHTIGSVLVGEKGRHPSNASNCSDVSDTKGEADNGPPILTQIPRPMNISTGTKSAYSNLPLLSATDVIYQVNKEKATPEAKCRESSSGSVLDDKSYHPDSITIAEFHQKKTGFHKENLFSFSISEPEKGQKSVKYSCSTLGNLGAERMSLQNPCQVSSVTGVSVNCNTENMAGSVISSRNASELSNFVNLQKEMGQKIVSRNNLQPQENIGLEEANSTSVKGGLSNPWPPVIHTFSILKSKDKLESIDREQYGVPDSINNLPAAINNCPMKGLKHIPILYSKEKIVHSQELTNNNNLYLSPSRHLHYGNKRKWSPSQRQQIADLVTYSPQPDFTSKYCFKRHKVFADKVENGHQNVKIPEGKEMAESVGFFPHELALELNGNNTDNSSVNFRLELSSPAHAAGQMSSVRTASQGMSSSESDWGKFLALSASSEPTTQGNNVEKEIIANFEHRFNKLQAFLKRCDESDQYYSQGFQNLSAMDRSVIAIKLEKQAMKLSLEEVKEFDRMNTLKIFRKPSIDTTNDVGAALILKLLLPNSS
ncbi:uncharacterized protein LOC131048202 isoform X1 [Cryptomeria japonica]|uniref:uncharacterized protein LOC131048202 isoform X1 n=2 Tax=Cryptomeria japonica TaxID=3369 RepID=UPI0027DA208A|nr:uncharacterized protein LOC131048202 isoform X1 [Cryptomeria japonica]